MLFVLSFFSDEVVGFWLLLPNKLDNSDFGYSIKILGARLTSTHHPHRIDFKTDQKSTNSFSKSFRLTNESQSRFKTFTLKLHYSSIQPLIFLKISNNSYLNLLPKQKPPQLRKPLKKLQQWQEITKPLRTRTDVTKANCLLLVTFQCPRARVRRAKSDHAIPRQELLGKEAQ